MLDTLEQTSPFEVVAEEDVERWDREWLHYLSHEPLAPHVIPGRHMVPIGSVAGKSPAEVFTTTMTRHPALPQDLPLRVWAPGDVIEGGRLLEVGCGTGVLSKHLGRVCEEYLGVDVSRLALAIARGGAFPNCRFLHVNDHEELAELAGRYQAMLCREFFIHHNYDSALRVLRFARAMLQPGGRVYGDFFMMVPDAQVGIVHSARSPRDPDHASCGYSYLEEDVAELAQEAGFTIVEQTIREDQYRRFVTLQKPG